MGLLGPSVDDDVWRTEASDVISDRKTLENIDFKAPRSRAELAPVSLCDDQCRKYYSFTLYHYYHLQWLDV